MMCSWHGFACIFKWGCCNLYLTICLVAVSLCVPDDYLPVLKIRMVILSKETGPTTLIVTHPLLSPWPPNFLFRLSIRSLTKFIPTSASLVMINPEPMHSSLFWPIKAFQLFIKITVMLSAVMKSRLDCSRFLIVLKDFEGTNAGFCSNDLACLLPFPIRALALSITADTPLTIIS